MLMTPHSSSLISYEKNYILFLEIFILIRESIKEWLILFPGKKISQFELQL